MTVSKHGQREVRALMIPIVLIAASGAISSLIPSVEAFLNFWVPVFLGVVLGLVVLAAAIRAVWERWGP